MHTSSRSVSGNIASVPPVVSSDSSQSVTSKNASHPVPVQVFEGHEDWVRCTCLYPDENKVVSGSDDNTLRIWDRKTGAVKVLSGHTGYVQAVNVSLDGNIVVSGSTDKTVRMWDGESGETIHIFEGHEGEVRSVQFSPDSTRIVSGSTDNTVRVWSAEMGELAFKPIECQGRVDCVRYSPTGDRIASGASSVQIWNAETGVGILSIRDSSVTSLAWTTDGTHVIGGGLATVVIWNSDNGEQLRTWKAHDGFIRGLSLSPTATRLVTSNWQEKTAFIFDISSGEQVAALEHHGDVHGIAFCPSGKLIATGCEDNKVYLWEAPASEDPKPKSPARPFSSLLDRPAILPAEPSRSDGRGLDPFWGSLPNRAQPQASPQPQRVFNSVRNTFANLVSRRPAVAVQTTPVREIVEPVEVAAGRDNTFWVVVAIPTYNVVERILYTIIHCRKPEDPDDDLPVATGTNSSGTTAGNAATGNQSEPAGDSVIRTQPKRTEMAIVQRLSGAEKPDGRPDSLQTPASKTATSNQRESIEMVAFPPATVSGRVSPQPPAAQATSYAPSTVAVTSTSLSIPSSISHPTTSQPSLREHIAPFLSPIEIGMIEEYRRRQATSAFVETAAKPLSDPAHDCAPGTPSLVSSFHHAKHTSTPHPSGVNAPPYPSSAPLDPVLIAAPSMPSTSPLSESSRLSRSASPPPTMTNKQ